MKNPTEVKRALLVAMSKSDSRQGDENIETGSPPTDKNSAVDERVTK